MAQKDRPLPPPLRPRPLPMHSLYPVSKRKITQHQAILKHTSKFRRLNTPVFIVTFTPYEHSLTSSWHCLNFQPPFLFPCIVSH
jgi:hypothetical protein